LALFVLALLGDVVPEWRAGVSRLFDRLANVKEPVEAAAS
jgi:hypothetical protein